MQSVLNFSAEFLSLAEYDRRSHHNACFDTDCLAVQLVERIRQLEPATMAQVDRLMEKEQGAAGRGKELSLDSVSPQIIATLTAMVDKEQALPPIMSIPPCHLFPSGQDCTPRSVC